MAPMSIQSDLSFIHKHIFYYKRKYVFKIHVSGFDSSKNYYNNLLLAVRLHLKHSFVFNMLQVRYVAR